MITNAQLDELSKVEIPEPLPFPFGFCKGGMSIEEGFWRLNHKGSAFEYPEFHFSVIDDEEPYVGEMHGDPDPDGENFQILEDAIHNRIFEDFGEAIDTAVMELTCAIETDKFETNDPNEVWAVISKRLTQLGGKEFSPEYLGG